MIFLLLDQRALDEMLFFLNRKFKKENKKKFLVILNFYFYYYYQNPINPTQNPDAFTKKKKCLIIQHSMCANKNAWWHF